MADTAPRDKNFVPALLATSSVDGVSTVTVYADPTTHRLLTESSGISSFFQTDTFLATSGQTIFTATKTVAYTIGFFIQTILTPTNTAGAQVDYTVTAGVATLSSASYPNGVPPGSIVLWVYVTS